MKVITLLQGIILINRSLYKQIDVTERKTDKKNEQFKLKTFPVLLDSEEITESMSLPTKKAKELSKESIINQAIQFHQEGNIVEAKKYYELCIKQGSKNPVLLSNYGLILKDQGKLNEAELSIRKAIELQPALAIAHANLGGILIDQGKLNEAELSIRKAIELQPTLVIAHANLGGILIDQGKLNEAELSIRKAIELQPTLDIAHANLGGILIDQGKLNEAELSIRKAIELQPALAIAHKLLAKCQVKKGKIEEAISSYSEAKKITPNDTEIHNSISFVLRDYIWITNNSSQKRVKNIEKIIKVEKEKLKLKLNQYPIWFVDIPRSSSTTIQFLMMDKYGWPFGKCTRISNDHIVHERSLVMPNHTPALITKYLLGKKYWDSLESFSIVRNPYTWCLSFWQSQLNDIPKFKYKCLSFLQFLYLLEENLKVAIKERKIYHTNLRQTDYLLDHDGKILVKQILKFEERETIESYLLDNEITSEVNLHINKNTNNDYQITNAERKIIERLFARDFEILGY